MIVSYNWLQTFFKEPLPSPEDVVEALTFHSWEIDGVEEKDGDFAIDVNVLPNTSMWALSHRGIAKDLSVILRRPLLRDSLKEKAALEPIADTIAIDLRSEDVLRYAAAHIQGVSVGPSPEWLQTCLRALGQKPINNVVDAANYIMFDMGQPLHAFDAGKLKGAGSHIAVRAARLGEEITALTGEAYTLSKGDLLIVDGADDAPIGIAGVKGGKQAEVDRETTDLLIEAANFDYVSVRKTSQRLRLRTDASVRFENGVVPELASYGLRDVVALILEIAGGTCTGYKDVFPKPRTAISVSVPLPKVNSVLGLSLTESDISDIAERFGYPYEMTNNILTVTAPFERTDLAIPEDVIAEIGRVYGYEHIPTVVPLRTELREINKRFFYADRVRDTLANLGFSEILTSSFREKDEVMLANALASDKAYLRSSLRENINEALERNRMNADLLGLSQIRVFEIGTVFTHDGEYMALTLGVRSSGGYKEKTDDPVLREALDAVERELGTVLPCETNNGIAESNIDLVIAPLPEPSAYVPFEKKEDVTFRSFSPYPFVSRDIALWVENDISARDVERVLNESAGDLRQRTTLFDTYKKDNRVSYAFRLVFQSYEKTLTDDEVNAVMEKVTEAISERGWEVR